ncbi:MAG: hypothetical protein GY780_04780 [bacterium]|nr:hypothetical protein [bacterium]
MAKKTNTDKKSFYEVVFQGKPKVVRAYLAGLAAGSDKDATVFFSFQDGVFHEGKVERLSELLHVRALDCHVIVDSDTSTRLKKLAKTLPETTGMKITDHRHIRSASLKFEFEAFAKKYNDEIVEVFKNLPSGLRLNGYSHDVKLDPSAEGIEAYAATHDYEAKGSGTVIGRVDLMIELKRSFYNLPLIKSDDIELKLA